MKIIQLKGTNGSGKSTIPFQLLAQSDDVAYTLNCTVLRDIGWVLIGQYVPGKLTSNGCDKMGTVADIKAAIMDAIEYHPGFNVVFEGMMISTIKSTFYDYLLALEQSHDIQPVFVIMDTDPIECIKRLDARGTRKAKLNVDNVIGKAELIIRHAKSYQSSYVRWFPVDTTTLEDMLSVFMDLVDESLPWHISYRTLTKLSNTEVHDELLQYASCDELDHGRRRRLLGKFVIEPDEIDRDECLVPTPSAPWDFQEMDGHRLMRCVGYRTGTGNELSLLVRAYMMDRADIPLLTEYEHITMCRDCGGANGGCPGYAPRFTDIELDSKAFCVLTISMDMAWAMEYASQRNSYMMLSYADLLTMTYTRRVLHALGECGYYTLGVSNCPGRCRPCAVSVSGHHCAKPNTRGFSMEAVGVDCDWLHSELYGEWLPWGYKSHWIVPSYMTRYAGFFTDFSISALNVVDALITNDKTFCAPPGIPQYDLYEFIIPSGAHRGCTQLVYDPWGREHGLRRIL